MSKISYSQLAIEFLSVVFAVLLALGLNAFKQSMDAKAEAETLKSSILKECIKNQVKVDSTLAKNQEFASYLDSLVKLEPDNVKGVSFNYEFELLTNAAWQIAQNNSAINNLDQQFLLDAADIYQTQVFYTDYTSGFFQNIGTYITQMDKTSPYNTALSFYYSMNVMNSSANDLLEKYEVFLEKYSPKESD